MLRTKKVKAFTQKGAETRFFYMNFILDDSRCLDFKQAVKDACMEFVKTEKGKSVLNETDNFDWNVFWNYVPNEICEKYGFQKYCIPDNELTVEYTESLVTKETQVWEEVKKVFPKEVNIHGVFSYPVVEAAS